MKISAEEKFYSLVPENLKNLADVCQFSLYIVGGSVRDFFAGYPIGSSADWDISAAAPEDALLEAAAKTGFAAKAVYRNTGTVKLSAGDGEDYEFTRFRSDKYVRGVHVPVATEFTDNITLDARRRDFSANAVYFDLKAKAFCDPLGGIDDIKRRTLRTVAPAEKVFGEDGLRLMRLARIAAQTSFSPDEECLAGAARNADLIGDIAPERIYTELVLLLHSDLKHGDETAPYRGLTLLKETGVLARILPELAAGDGMLQRSDYHKYDVLEHSLRCVRYSPPDIRFAALLHDVGKPYCFTRDGNFYGHPEEGARIAEEILARLKAPKKLIKETAELVLLHMRDFNLQMKESKVRLTIVDNFPLLEKLLALKQADFSACRDDLSPAPSVLKWREILSKMEEEGAPRTLKELKIDGKTLQKCGMPPAKTGEALNFLLRYAALDSARNTEEHLKKHAKKLFTEA